MAELMKKALDLQNTSPRDIVIADVDVVDADGWAFIRIGGVKIGRVHKATSTVEHFSARIHGRVLTARYTI